MPSVVLHRQALHKSPKIVCGLRTLSAECSKLGKTRIIEDADIRLARNATFFSNEFPSVFPHEIHKCVSYNIIAY